MRERLSDKKIDGYMKHLSVDSAIRQALIEAFYDGRQDMWNEIQAQTQAILEMKAKELVGDSPVEK